MSPQIRAGLAAAMMCLAPYGLANGQAKPAQASDSPGGNAPLSDQAAGEPAGTKDDKKPDHKGRWIVFPIISSSPETSLMLGGLTMYHFRMRGSEGRLANGKVPRRSAIGLATAYTLKHQFIFSFFPNLYLQGETWNIDANVDANWFPSTFYEVGRDSDADSAEDFSERALGVTVKVTRSVVSSVRAGGRVAFRHSKLTDVETGGLLDGGQVLGSDGGRLVGAGPIVSWDNRDQDMSATSGAVYQLSAMFYPRAFGSDFGHATFVVDARRYMLVTATHVLAVQGYARLSRGDVPFQNLARLGGSNALRGYFDTRHVDRHMLAAQVEYRLPLWWKIGGTVFGGVGDVAATVSEFDATDPKFAGGIGLRYSLNAKDRVNLRLDAAVTGEADTGVYINLGEAF